MHASTYPQLREGTSWRVVGNNHRNEIRAKTIKLQIKQRRGSTTMIYERMKAHTECLL